MSRRIHYFVLAVGAIYENHANLLIIEMSVVFQFLGLKYHELVVYFGKDFKFEAIVCEDQCRTLHYFSFSHWFNHEID